MNELGNISIRALLIFIDVYETQNFSVVARRKGYLPLRFRASSIRWRMCSGSSFLPQYPGDNSDGRPSFYPLCASHDWQHGGGAAGTQRENA